MTDAARVREGRETRSRVRLVVFVLVVALFLALWGKDVPIWGGCTAHLTVCGNVFSIGIFQGMIIALIALGYTLVYGILQLINFAHGDVSIFKALGLPISGSAPIAEIILWLALTLPITMVLTALLNAGIERYAYRPLRRAPTVATLISAIGMSFILQNAGQKVLGASPVSLVQGSDPSILSSADVFVLFGEIHIKFSHLFVTAITIPLLFALVWFVANTRQGKAMRAVAQDREAAGLMGINVDRTISLTFLLAGALAGGAGLIVALYNGQAWWFYGTPFGLQAFTAAVFGGIGNLKGAAVGGIILGIMISLNAYYIDPRWQEVVVFGLLVVVLIFKPTGLFGSAQSERA
jgi:branched-chain amino acid transport system permease protein